MRIEIIDEKCDMITDFELESNPFKVGEKKLVTIAGNWYEHIHGIRPILRYFQKTRLYTLI